MMMMTMTKERVGLKRSIGLRCRGGRGENEAWNTVDDGGRATYRTITLLMVTNELFHYRVPGGARRATHTHTHTKNKENSNPPVDHRMEFR